MQSVFFSETDIAYEEVSQLYNRSDKSINEDVATLKEWMRIQPHLPEILDDRSIYNFLILNKCSVEKAKLRIDMYYTIRTRIPDFFENANPKNPNIKETMEILSWVLLPKLTKDMYRVWLCKTRNKNVVDKIHLPDTVSFLMDIQELRLKEDIMLGDIHIFDMEAITFGIMAKVTPSFVMKSLAIYEKVYSTPLKAIYFVNSPPFIVSFMSILKSMMKPKLFARIHVCENTSILLEKLPKEILPEDYGGEEKSVEELQELLKIVMNHYQDRYDQLDRLKVDENLRPEKLQNHEDLGFYGNFKKLDVD